MANRDIIVIGASAGGVEALTQFVKQLPANFPAALFIVLHFPAFSVSVLPKILSRAGKLPAFHPSDQTVIELRQIYIAPPNYHLLIRPGYIRLNQGPREHGHRPAIDTTFRSAARAYGSRVIGVILTGTLDDGTAGLLTIKSQGGLAIVQDPDDALFDGMPRSALKYVAVDHIVKLSNLASCLSQLIHDPIKENRSVSEPLDREEIIVAHDKAARERGEHPGNPSPFTCPDCGGVLWELRDGNLVRFRCHVGHAYSIESMAAEQADEVERALWSANRALEEKAALARRMAVQAQQSNRSASEAQFLVRAQEAEQHAALLRQMILQQEASQPPANSANTDE
ncbi:chemotaxis protein CheB [Pantanalinema rosaneae CENA516]|uniref:chemotaxis protein CheB n=1 Tax=Pantanalinema rosaneae TaxID=1620701 RepID=UPI003D6FF41F